MIACISATCTSDVIKVFGVDVGNKPSGNVKGQEILELDVASAVKRSRRREVERADSPQADNQHDRLSAKAARVQPFQERCQPDRRWLCRKGHDTGSAFFTASSIDWPGRSVFGTIRQPSSYSRNPTLDL